MMAETPRTRVLLLVEDNPGDAHLVADLLANSGGEVFHVIHVALLAEAVDRMRHQSVDVVVLDLRLPDGSGVASVRAVREVAGKVPIVVLTGSEDEELALSCIDAGAQDYLAKSEVRPQNLRRAIGYAITRIREAQLRELEETLDRYRALSSANQGTTMTAALAGSGAVSVRSPETFARIVEEYCTLLEPYLQGTAGRVEPPRQVLERLITQLGDANGGPRDLLDIHVAALDRAMAPGKHPHSQSLVLEGRLVALEMMGLLVDYYRVGIRRMSWSGEAS